MAWRSAQSCRGSAAGGRWRRVGCDAAGQQAQGSWSGLAAVQTSECRPPDLGSWDGAVSSESSPCRGHATLHRREAPAAHLVVAGGVDAFD